MNAALDVPADVVRALAASLPGSDFAALEACNKAWLETSERLQLWQQLYHQRWPVDAVDAPEQAQPSAPWRRLYADRTTRVRHELAPFAASLSMHPVDTQQPRACQQKRLFTLWNEPPAKRVEYLTWCSLLEAMHRADASLADLLEHVAAPAGGKASPVGVLAALQYLRQRAALTRRSQQLIEPCAFQDLQKRLQAKYGAPDVAEDCTKRPAPGQLTSTRRPPLAELPAGASGSKLCGHDAAPPRQCEVDIQSLKEFAVATGCSEQQITLRWWELGTLMNLVGWRTNDQMLSRTFSVSAAFGGADSERIWRVLDRGCKHEIKNIHLEYDV